MAFKTGHPVCRLRTRVGLWPGVREGRELKVGFGPSEIATSGTKRDDSCLSRFLGILLLCPERRWRR